MAPSRLTRRALITLIALWLCVVLAGLGGLAVYANAAGAPGAPPASWPGDSALARPERGGTLLMFVHPQCPCSRASINELARLMTSTHDRLAARVVVYRPAGESIEWAQSDLWTAAARIPGVSVSIDDDGAESERFGVAVSGHTLLYDDRGALAFSGGITSARGHEGDNAGRAAVAALALDGKSRLNRTPVFGCFIRPAD